MSQSPSKLSANERRCYICNIFSHWLTPCWDRANGSRSQTEITFNIWDQGPISIFPIRKIRQLWDHLHFMMGIHILVRQHLDFEMISKGCFNIIMSPELLRKDGIKTLFLWEFYNEKVLYYIEMGPKINTETYILYTSEWVSEWLSLTALSRQWTSGSM